MRKARLLLLAAFIAAMTIFPAAPALATHSCAFEPGSFEQYACEYLPHHIFDSVNNLLCKWFC